MSGLVPDKITVELLKSKGACEGNLELFNEIFPDGMELSAANLRLASNAGLGIVWGIDRFLDEETTLKLRSAMQNAASVFRSSSQDAQFAYHEACASAVKDYWQTRNQAFEDIPNKNEGVHSFAEDDPTYQKVVGEAEDVLVKAKQDASLARDNAIWMAKIAYNNVIAEELIRVLELT